MSQNQFFTSQRQSHVVCYVTGSDIASQKIGEAKILTLGEKQYFVWDTASRSTK